VTLRDDPRRRPGTAFVVAMEDGKAYLVTSAHVVEGGPTRKSSSLPLGVK